MDMKKLILSSVALASLCCASGSAFALANGVFPADGQVINPITGTETKVWKLVGTAGASAFQIHRKWILASRHGHPSGGTFTNHLGTSQVGQCFMGNDLSEAQYNSPRGDTGPNDFALCPLLQPLQITDFGTYPPLVSEPTRNEINRSKFGALLAYGYGWSSAQLAIVDFEGVPYGHQPLRNTGTVRAPLNVGGDSGGGAFWFSPTSPTPAVIGVVTGGAITPFGISYFTEASVNWIRNKIAAAGDTPPATLTAAQHYTGPAGDIAPDLGNAPSTTVSGSAVSVSWVTPAGAAGSTVTSYEVSLGANGSPITSKTIAASTGNATSFTGIATGNRYKVCVRPANAVGPSRIARTRYANPSPEVWEVNCTAFNTLAPNAVGGVTQTSAADPKTGLSKVTLTWAEPAPLADVTLRNYRITRSVTTPAGAKRTSTFEQIALTNNAFVQKGSTVCSSVSSVSVNAASPQVCTLAK
jgi:Fibronectin type III domain